MIKTMSRNKNRVSKPNSLQAQIMRRIAPIVIIGFVLMTLLGIILYRQNLETRVRGDLALKMDQKAVVVDEFFDKLPKVLRRNPVFFVKKQQIIVGKAGLAGVEELAKRPGIVEPDQPVRPLAFAIIEFEIAPRRPGPVEARIGSVAKKRP